MAVLRAVPSVHRMTAEAATRRAGGVRRVRARSPRSKSRLAGLFQFLEGTGSSAGQVFILGSLAASGLAEIPLQAWLIFVGVNSERWYQRAREAELPSPARSW